MGESEQAADKAEALSRLQDIVATFGIERRMEDEPAHHEQALERLALREESR